MDDGWRWRILNRAGDVGEERRETFTTIAAALSSGAGRLPVIDGAPRTVAETWRRSASGLQ